MEALKQLKTYSSEKLACMPLFADATKEYKSLVSGEIASYLVATGSNPELLAIKRFILGCACAHRYQSQLFNWVGLDTTGTGSKAIQLSYVDMTKLNMTAMNLVGANLEQADLSDSNLAGTNFESANLCGAKFQRSNAAEVNFKKANLRNANFSNTKLVDADFTDAMVQGADFEGHDVLSGTYTGLDIASIEKYDDLPPRPCCIVS